VSFQVDMLGVSGRPPENDCPVELNPEQITAIDPSDMFAAVAGLPRQLREGYTNARATLLDAGDSLLATPAGGWRALIVCGMGGSAIGIDLVLACLPDLATPRAVIRGYDVPAWARAGTLVIVVSYSGGTEEALSCAAQARERGCTTVCVCSGGELASMATAEGWPLLLVPGGRQPRAAVGSLAMALLAVLAAAGLAGDHAAEVAATAAQLEEDAVRLTPDAAEGQNPAKALARCLYGRLALVYGAGPTLPVARRWKGQINENAKAPAFLNELPELDHNEIMGWTSLPQFTTAGFAIFLHDAAGGARLRRRVELTARQYGSLGIDTVLVGAQGDSRLARLFSLVQLGDYVSCYLAALYGVDPTPVDAIQEFKRKLAADD